MKIAILTLGTRGDVQPYAVLGKALKEKGHDVVFSTAKNFKPLIERFSLPFVGVDADFEAILASEEGKKILKANPFAIRRNLHKWIYPLITDSLNTFYSIAKKSDIVLYHVKTLADCFADQLPEKMIRASVLPIIEPTKEFANPSFSGLPLPRFLNRLTYTLSNKSIGLLNKPISNFRERNGLSRSFNIPIVKNIYGLSGSFLPKPKDYHSDSSFDGFWNDHTDEMLPEDLESFINKGTAPLLITFGSMPVKTKFEIQKIVLKITQELESRIILIKGWGIEALEQLDNHPDIKVISGAPYHILFPKVKAVIHHGGIGTTSACLQAGVPFWICPILHPIGDQNFWGHVAQKKGVGLKPIPLKKITTETFINNTRTLLQTKELYNNAALLKKEVDKEDGLSATIKKIEEHYD